MGNDDPVQEYLKAIEDAEHTAANLFATISKKLTPEEARRIFTDILKRPRGRRQTPQDKNIDGFLRALLNAGVTNIRDLAKWAYKIKLVHSEEAGEKRLYRLLKVHKRKPDK